MKAEITKPTQKLSTQARTSEHVVQAVADAKGVDVTELETRLYDVINPDSLDSLFHTADTHPTIHGEVTFTMEGCEVVVRSDGTVTATAPEESA